MTADPQTLPQPPAHPIPAALAREVVAIRRDLHEHPELSWAEERTTAVVGRHLEAAGVHVRRLATTGLVAEVGAGAGTDRRVPTVALRADIDALPVPDLTTDAWRSRTEGVAHACGHDVHTAALVGAALALAQRHARQPLAGRVRMLFQPAEEVMPGGAHALVEQGVLDGVSSIFALHCDPALDVGRIGVREGPITAAADQIVVRLHGRGGHTSRPHLTSDLTFALAKVVTDVPAALSRRLDPRAGATLVWGYVRAGAAKNVIPGTGEAGGTLRMLWIIEWAQARELVTSLVQQVVAPYGVTAEVEYVRGVPPVVNTPGATALLAAAAQTVVGPDHVGSTSQSLGGEDFAWYLADVPGAMARLGTATPGGPRYDLHRGDLRIDERAVALGAGVLAATALAALAG
ncbi:MAG: amidohydrolase [Actinomycetota bacterium]